MPRPSSRLFSISRRLLRSTHAFGSDRGGGVAIIVALSSLPLMGFVGAAVDYGLAVRLKTQLQAGSDATVLMLCQTPSTTTNSSLNSRSLTSMTSYMGSEVGLSVDSLAITSNPRTIMMTSRAVSKSYFSRFLTGSDIPISTSSQCASPVPKTFEIALVLDTTGSMANSGGSGSKLSAMQSAASDFVDYVKTDPAFSPETRISIVPFAASVNVGSAYAGANWVDTAGASSYHWANIDKTLAAAAGFTNRFSIFTQLSLKNSAWSWGGCFETPSYPYNVQDGLPTSNDAMFVPLFAPDEPGDGDKDRVKFSTNTSNFYSYNSYIDDTTDMPGCKANPTTFQAAENSACKYINAKGASYTTNSGVGIPNGPNFMCTSKPLQRLTTSVSTLKSLINGLTASGATNIHEGFMWGWRTISPSSVFGDGVAYSSATTNKVIVLMTDGANSWSDNPYNNYNQTLFFPLGYFVNANGSTPDSRVPVGYRNLSNAANARSALDRLTSEACTNAKTAGISVYTIGLNVSSDPIDSQGMSLLQSCATSGSQAYVANDSSSLIAAFKKIASSIGQIRLIQ